MRDEGILDGDYVIVERRDTASNGERVVALLPNGETTLKTLFREPDGRLELPDAFIGLEITADLSKCDALVGDEVGAEDVAEPRRVPAEIDFLFDQRPAAIGGTVANPAQSKVRHVPDGIRTARHGFENHCWRGVDEHGGPHGAAARTRVERGTDHDFVIFDALSLGRGEIEIRRPRSARGKSQPEARYSRHPLRCTAHG
jgi:hypothetical protein